MLRDFVAFLREWGVVGLAVAVIIGGKLNEWVNALVEDIMMPLIGLVLPGGNWREFTVRVGPDSHLLVGHFLGATLDFVIVALIVYFVFSRVFRNTEAIKSLEGKKAKQ